jgi:transcriptional regulator with XRE-family HTH domain
MRTTHKIVLYAYYRRVILAAPMAKISSWNQSAFALRLRVTLHMRGTTQKQLAAELGINQATISRWQSNRASYPNLDHIQTAAKILKVEACWLVFGCAEHVPPEYDELHYAMGFRRARLR